MVFGNNSRIAEKIVLRYMSPIPSNDIPLDEEFIQRQCHGMSFMINDSIRFVSNKTENVKKEAHLLQVVDIEPRDVKVVTSNLKTRFLIELPT